MTTAAASPLAAAPTRSGSPSTARSLRRVATEAVATVVAVAGPAVNAAVSPANRWWVIVAAGTAASLALAVLPARLWPLRLGVILATSVALERAEGPMLGAWVGLGLLLSDWAIRRRRPVPWVPAPDPAAAVPVALLLLLAARQATDVNSGGRPLRFVAVAAAIALVGATTGDLLTRLRSSVASHLARGATSLIQSTVPAPALPRPDDRRWAEAPIPPGPRPAGPSPLWGMGLLVALGIRQIWVHGLGIRALVPFALAAVLAVAAARTGDLLPRVAARVGHAAGQVVGRIGFLVLGLPVLVLPWALQRTFRTDPLLPTGRDPGWYRRARPDPEPGHPWASDPIADRTPRGYRLRRAGALPAVLALVALVVVAERQGALSNLGGGGARDRPIPAAYADAEWYPQHRADLDWATSTGGGVWRPLRPKRVRDMRSQTVNVRGGERVTWAPPPCDCPRLTVWVYGGSTTFGVGQRDAHTIPSELARAAWDEGIALDVSNRGLPGLVFWTEANQLAWDLTVEDPPDLVVFYDGANELWATAHVRDEHDLDERIEPLSEDIWNGVAGTDPTQDPPEGAELIAVPTLPAASMADGGERAVELYDRARKMALDTAEANDLPVRFFWQPSRFSRPPIPGEPTADGGEAATREMYEAAEAAVPDGVGDLTQALDGSDEPLFSDEVHHNEEGARLIAAAMLAQLHSQIDELLDAEEGR